MVFGNEIPEQHLVVLLSNPVEIAEPQHPVRQGRRGHFPVAGQHTHGLVVQEAVGQPVQPGRFHPSFLQIQLDQGNPLEQFPGNGGRQHGPDLRFIFPDHEPHFRGQIPPSRPPHPLEE